jgi:hypothetical protein
LRTAPGLRTGLELELLLASTSGTRTGSTLDLLVDLETLIGLLLLHSMHQSWSYAWVSCPHHILLQWTQNEELECFSAFPIPSECKVMQNLCFKPECTIWGYRSCEYGFVTKASILLRWTQNDYLECFGAFRKLWENKMMQNLCFGPECTILWYQRGKNCS